MRAFALKTEYMHNPIGIDAEKPRLSWLCADGIKQSAYELRARRGEEEVFRSGRVESDRMYASFDAPLHSRDRITWQLRLWDENGAPGPWSEEAFFVMGRLKVGDCAASWINPELTCDPGIHKPASYLRKCFTLGGPVSHARLYVTCHGLYEVWLNGARVGDFVLAPGSSSYHERLHVQTYDVSALLWEGENRVEVLLGDGWYRSCCGVDGDRNLYGEDTALFFQLENAGKPVCLSDGSWEASQEGPIRMNDMQQGEIVDARRENITGWHGVKLEDFGVKNLRASNCVPVTEHERFAGRLFTTPNGETVLDFGQNLAGYVEFTLTAHAGETLVLTHGETLDENGNFTQVKFSGPPAPQGGRHPPAGGLYLQGGRKPLQNKVLHLGLPLCQGGDRRRPERRCLHRHCGLLGYGAPRLAGDRQPARRPSGGKHVLEHEVQLLRRAHRLPHPRTRGLDWGHGSLH